MSDTSNPPPPAPTEPIATAEDEDPVRPRQHGFDWPMEQSQLIAWFNILFLFIIFWTLHAPFLPYPSCVVLSAIFAATSIAVVILKASCTLIQTADDGVAAEMVYTPENFLNIAVPEGKILCMYCKTIVTEDCKHCRACDKCIVGFDHHCMWLGACVGVKTYRLFFVFTVTTLFLMTYQAAIGWYLFAASVMDKDLFEHKVRRFHLVINNAIVYQVFVFLIALYETFGVMALGNLVGFHIFLKISNQSTYAWILKRREQKKQAEARGEDTRSTKSALQILLPHKQCHVFRLRDYHYTHNPSLHHPHTTHT